MRQGDSDNHDAKLGYWPSFPVGSKTGAHDKNQGGEEIKHAGSESVEKEKGDARSRCGFILP